MRWNSNLLLAATLLGTALAPSAAMAQNAGDVLVHLRAIGILPDVAGTTDVLGGSFEATNEYVPEIGLTYFFSDRVAAELSISTANFGIDLQNSTAGNLEIGNARFAPVIGTLQYRFDSGPMVSPYIGAGFSYLIAADQSAGSGINNISYSNGFGFAFQAGFDVPFNDNWTFNLDAKKLVVGSDVAINNGTIQAKGVDFDPLIFGIGVGYIIR
jgi:outer membrane protein